MSFSIGIVGLPNVGKSTLFKALTKKQVDASNYPFCTIDPNVGVVPVPDDRLQQLATTATSEQIIPTTVEFVDIAGLVKGAHEGEGLGNKFLQHIREVDAIAHVVRHFTDSNVIHVAGKVDPQTDQEIIHLELILADLQVITSRLHRLDKQARGQGKEAIKTNEAVMKLKNALDNNQPARSVELTPEEQLLVKDLNLLTSKPMIHVVNADEDMIGELSQRHLDDVVYVSAKIEAEISELGTDEQKEYLQTLGMPSSGLDRLIAEAYKTLNLLTYFTVGPKETRAWTIPAGATAPQAAGVIHTDFEKGFIRAEIISWKDYVDAGSEAKAKEQGKMRMEGKDYIMRDGDTAHFHHN